MGDAAIETDGLTFAYDDAPAVDDVATAIPQGSIAALLGPNGAGKTTFVRLVTGTLAPDRGSVTVYGSDPRRLDRERLGVLPQSFMPEERLTPRELVAYYGGLYDVAREPAAVLADVGLDDAADRRYHRLSGGQQRRCCLAIALVNDPDLLVLDEPTTGIDPAGKRDLWSYLPTLVDDGTTMLVTTHDMREAEHLADHLGFFHGGSLLAFGRAEALVAEHLGRRHLRIETPTPGAVADALDGTARDGAVVVESVTPADLPALVSTAVDAGEVTALRWEPPPLEELFHALVSPGDGDA